MVSSMNKDSVIALPREFSKYFVSLGAKTSPLMLEVFAAFCVCYTHDDVNVDMGIAAWTAAENQQHTHVDDSPHWSFIRESEYANFDLFVNTGISV